MQKGLSYLSKIKEIVGHNGAIYDVLYENGKLLTASADLFIAQWDIALEKQTDFAIKLEKSAYNIGFSPQSQLLVIGTNNGDIHVVDMYKKEEIKLVKHHSSAVFSVVYNPFTHQFYTADDEGMFCAWSGDSFELLISLPFDCGRIREIAINEEGTYLALCCKDGKVRILETEFFNLLQTFKCQNDGLNCALFDGEILLTGGKDAYIRKWNWRTGEKLKSIPAHNYAVYDLIFLSNKKYIVSVSFDKSIKLWKNEDLTFIEKAEFRQGGHRHVVNRIAKISDYCFATVSDDRRIKVWELTKI